MLGRAIKCVGRRRIVVATEGQQTMLMVWLGDPPGGKRIATLELEPIERDKLILALTETKANG